MKRKRAEIFSEEESASFREATNADILDESKIRDVIQNLSQFLQTRTVDATQGEEMSESSDLPSDPVVPPQSSTPCPIQFEEDGVEPTVIEETESFIEFPCRKCNKEVSDDDDAILCDGLCQCWFHLSCTNLSDEEFQRLGQGFHLEWRCPNCDSGVLNDTVLPRLFETPEPKPQTSRPTWKQQPPAKFANYVLPSLFTG